jgi:hypothetical protein
MVSRAVKRRRMLLLAGGILATAAMAFAQPTEYELKAIFLYNFAKYVDWPDTADADATSLDLCVLGEDPFGEALDDTVRGETVRGRTLQVRRLDVVSASEGCEIVFVSSSERSRLDRILAALDEKRVLTVGDMEHFAERGGIIQLVNEENRLRLEINMHAAQESGLKISSQLLKLGRIVQTEDG